MRLHIVAISLITLCSALAGCEAQPVARAAADAPASAQMPIGANCVLQFRRDALGAGASTPISATERTLNGAVLSLEGTLALMNSDWVVLTRSDKSQCWVARSAVLMITITPATQAR